MHRELLLHVFWLQLAKYLLVLFSIFLLVLHDFFEGFLGGGPPWDLFIVFAHVANLVKVFEAFDSLGLLSFLFLAHSFTINIRWRMTQAHLCLTLPVLNVLDFENFGVFLVVSDHLVRLVKLSI